MCKLSEIMIILCLILVFECPWKIWCEAPDQWRSRSYILAVTEGGAKVAKESGCARLKIIDGRWVFRNRKTGEIVKDVYQIHIIPIKNVI
jgi:hypothetical protein